MGLDAVVRCTAIREDNPEVVGVLKRENLNLVQYSLRIFTLMRKISSVQNY